MPHRSFIQMLAMALLAGEQTRERILERTIRTLGRPWPWLAPLADRYLDAFQSRTRPRRREVVEFLHRDESFRTALAKHADELQIERWWPETQRMQPAAAARTWNVPPIESVRALADWLKVAPGELDWYADLKGLGLHKGGDRLHHYTYRFLEKRGGDIRVLEAPKPKLKHLQRQILSGILEGIPMHDSVHGFRKGRSTITFVQPHAGRSAVLRMDLQDFFPSLTGSRIQAFFRTAGYPEAVADLLGGVCTNVVPPHVWKPAVSRFHSRATQQAHVLYSRPHLPQGAPTSPALANACAYRIDCRMEGIAQSAGAEYTRYADDLAFSGDGDFARNARRFSLHVAAILLEEGFHVNHRKTRLMRQGVRQYLAGLVANHTINVPRPDFDLLKATLTNCARLGPASQNREGNPAFRAHLEGRVAFMQGVNPAKASRLRAILDEIRWE